MKNTELVLFDLDNTLFDFESYWMQATKEYFYLSSITKNLSFEDFFSRFSYYDHYFWELHHLGEQSLDEVRQQRLIHSLVHFNIQITAEEASSYFAGFFNHLLSLLRPDEKVKSFLNDLKQAFKIAIITNGKVEEQRSKLLRLGLDELFTEDEIFISEGMGYGKPKEEAFHLPLSKLNVERIRTVYVGDSWSNDIVGASEAGIDAIWLNPKGLEPKTPHKPLATISNLFDLKHLLPLKDKVEV